MYRKKAGVAQVCGLSRFGAKPSARAIKAKKFDEEDNIDYICIFIDHNAVFVSVCYLTPHFTGHMCWLIHVSISKYLRKKSWHFEC